MATRKTKAERRAATAIPRPSKMRMSRADKLVATRSKLLTAATQIVGAEGYSNASVAKITARARVAQGTFYNYFGSQQDLFDQLLPELGSEMLGHIRARISEAPDGLSREEIGFRAFFEYLSETPQFYRVLNEAETFSPKAFRDHMSNMIQGYLRALQRGQEQGALPGYSANEFEVIVCILLGARNYLAHHFVIRTDHAGPVPEWIVRAYMKFVAAGLMYGGTSGPTYRPKRAMTDGGRGVAVGAEGRRVVSSRDGGAVLELRIDDAHRDSAGWVRRAVLIDLAASAAELAVGGERSSAPPLASISSNILGLTHAIRLVASARCERRGNGAAHVTVAVNEDKRDGVPVLTAQATFIERSGT